MIYRNMIPSKKPNKNTLQITDINIKDLSESNNDIKEFIIEENPSQENIKQLIWENPKENVAGENHSTIFELHKTT